MNHVSSIRDWWLLMSVALLFTQLPVVHASDSDVESKVKKLLSAYEKVEFLNPTELIAGSGWTHANENGEVFHRNILRYQADPLIKLGRPALPFLINWVDHKRFEMRYIAIYSIERISGESAGIGYFLSQNEIINQGLKNQLQRKLFGGK